jgi:colanic acid biosynthesis protein WcaH
MWIPEDIYQCILTSMPIPCVDLLVTDEKGRVLMIRRNNPPAKGHWWFPGGRVHYGETRQAAVRRKLQEECGLTASQLAELGTYDVIIEEPGAPVSHGITTLFSMTVRGSLSAALDSQSTAYDWRRPEEWQQENIHQFLRDSIRLLQ